MNVREFQWQIDIEKNTASNFKQSLFNACFVDTYLIQGWIVGEHGKSLKCVSSLFNFLGHKDIETW